MKSNDATVEYKRSTRPHSLVQVLGMFRSYRSVHHSDEAKPCELKTGKTGLLNSFRSPPPSKYQGHRTKAIHRFHDTHEHLEFYMPRAQDECFAVGFLEGVQ